MSDFKLIAGLFTPPAILTLVFLILRLTGTIEWSWVWIISPIWIYILVGALAVAGMLILVKIREKIFGR